MNDILKIFKFDLPFLYPGVGFSHILFRESESQYFSIFFICYKLGDNFISREDIIFIPSNLVYQEVNDENIESITFTVIESHIKKEYENYLQNEKIILESREIKLKLINEKEFLFLYAEKEFLTNVFTKMLQVNDSLIQNKLRELRRFISAIEMTEYRE